MGRNETEEIAIGKRKTHEEFVAEVKEKVGNEYVVIGEYVSAKTPIEFEHRCGYRISRTPDKFLSKKRFCPRCDGTADVWDDKKYKDFVYLEGRGDYEVLSTYTGMNNPIKLKHSSCGHIYENSARVFREGGRCPKCRYKSSVPPNKLTHKEFLSRLTKEQLDSFDVLSEYKGTSEPVTIRCKKCNHIGHPLPANLFRGNGACNNCAIKKSKTTKRQIFKERFLSEVAKYSEYEVLSDYKDSHSKVIFKHLECGHEYESAPNYFMSGNRCPKCASSKGEKRIQTYLESQTNLIFEKEFTFDDLVYKNKLRFDFAILDGSNNPKLLIEFDGLHHFQNIEYFKSNLETVKKRDELKNNYCKERNIKLLRIPYYEFDNIENILRNEVS
ncbi:hypothetical protein [Neobacillus niacini]|uniref:hypothetical protein n=1 Tax=Neobacillus niacini TaxID=86668 RepID=UPI00285C7836|nr:hypothetical protein [Neobacillus niacini]MDR7001559.1 Zn finger protein HypA/HybF involved in hydrogenase expression [Neobacillus niacini]